MASLTPQERRAAILALETLAQAIAAAGPAGLPSGHLYASCMAHLSLDGYYAALALLKREGLVRETSPHLLVWCGPVRATIKAEG